MFDGWPTVPDGGGVVLRHSEAVVRSWETGGNMDKAAIGLC
jgi:hypothetical protein